MTYILLRLWVFENSFLQQEVSLKMAKYSEVLERKQTIQWTLELHCADWLEGKTALLQCNYHVNQKIFTCWVDTSYWKNFENLSKQSRKVQMQSNHLVPAFEWILPPLHQVALTDPRDTEVQRGAGNWTHIQMLQVVHHLPVTRLWQRKRQVLQNNIYNYTKDQTLSFSNLVS